MVPDYVTVMLPDFPLCGASFTTLNLAGTSSAYVIDQEGKLVDKVGQRWFAHGKVILCEDVTDRFFIAKFNSGVCQSVVACADEPSRDRRTAHVTRIPYDWDPKGG